VVHGTVALDAERKPAGVIGVADREVDPVAGGADLASDVVSPGADRAYDGLLEWALGLSARIERTVDLERDRPACGVVEIPSQLVDATGAG
jgi:hypothetical protein